MRSLLWKSRLTIKSWNEHGSTNINDIHDFHTNNHSIFHHFHVNKNKKNKNHR